MANNNSLDETTQQLILELEQQRREEEERFVEQRDSIFEVSKVLLSEPEPPTALNILKFYPGAIRPTIESEPSTLSELTSQFIGGASFGLVESEDPKNMWGIAAKGLGYMAGGIGLFLVSNAAAPMIGSLLGLSGAVARYGVPAIRMGLEASALTALTAEDEDNILAEAGKNAGLVVGSEGIINLIRARGNPAAALALWAYNKSKTPQEVLRQAATMEESQVGKELAKLGAAEHIPTIQGTKLQKNIIEFTKTANDLETRTNILELEARQIENLARSHPTKSFKQLQEELIDNIKTRVDSIADDLVIQLPQVQPLRSGRYIKRVYDTLSEIDTASMSGKDIAQAFLLTMRSKFPSAANQAQRFIDNPDLKPALEALPPAISRRVAALKSSLTRMDENIRVGLEPTASHTQYLKKLDDIEKSIIEGREKFMSLTKSDPERVALKQKAQGLIDEILKDPDKRFSTEFPLLADYTGFQQALGKVLPEEIPVDRIIKAREIAKKAERQTKKIPQKLAESISKFITHVDIDEANNIDEIYKLIQAGIPNITNHKAIGQARRWSTKTLVSFFKNQGDDLIPDSPTNQQLMGLKQQRMQASQQGRYMDVEQLDQQIQALTNQQITELLTNPALMRQAIDKSRSDALDNLYQYWRAVHGDADAEIMLIAKHKMADRVVTRNITINNAMAELADDVDIPPPPDGTPPVSGTPRGYFSHTDDVTSFGRLVRDTEAMIKSKGDDAAIHAWETTRAAEIAHNRYAQKMLPTLMKNFTKFVQESNPNSAQEGIQLIRTLDRMSDDMFLAGKTVDDIYAEGQRILSKASPRAREIQAEYQKITDELLDYNNKFINEYNQSVPKNKQIPEVKYRPYYMPHIDGGALDIKVIDDGIAHLFARASNEVDAHNKIIRLLKERPQYKDRIILEPRWLSNLDDVAALRPLLKDIDFIYGKDALDIRKLIDQGKFTPKNLRNVFFGNRLQRLGTLEDFIQDPIKALWLYGYALGKFAHFIKPVDMLEQAAKGLELQGKRNVAAALRTLGDDILGRPRFTEKVIDKFMNDLLTGIDKTTGGMLTMLGYAPGARVTKSVSGLLSLFGRAATIGMNLSTATINLAILATNVGAVIPARTVFNASVKYAKAWKNPVYKKLFEDAGIDLPGVTWGLREAMVTPEILTGKPRRFLDWLDSRVSMGFFSRTEKWSKGIALVAARDHADVVARKLIKGKTPSGMAEKLYADTAKRLGRRLDDDMVKHNFAVELMHRTTFNYNKAGLAEVFRNPALKPFLQFKTFMTRELGFYFGLAVNKNFKDLFKATAAFTALGGFMGLPGTNELDALMTRYTGVSPKWWFLQNFGEVAMAGLPRMVGIDFSNRINPSDLSFALDPRALVGIFPMKLGQSVSAAMSGRHSEALAYMTPPAVRSIIEGVELLTTGKITSGIKGGVPILTDKDLTNPVIQKIGLFMGFAPSYIRDSQAYQQLVYEKRNKAQRDRRAALRLAHDLWFEDGDKTKALEIMKQNDLKMKDLNRERDRRTTEVRDATGNQIPVYQREELREFERLIEEDEE